jgi:hypothetical protein
LERYEGLNFRGLFCEFFLGLGTSLKIFFKNQGYDCKTSGPWVDYAKVEGPFCKVSELNRNNELFLYRKSCGFGPRVVDHGLVAWSIMDRQRRGQEGTEAWWHACQSKASGHSRARELTGGVEKGRGEHRAPVSVLTGARAAVWWPGDGDEAVVEEKLDGDNAQALREGKRGGGGVVGSGGGGLVL